MDNSIGRIDFVLCSAETSQHLHFPSQEAHELFDSIGIDDTRIQRYTPQSMASDSHPLVDIASTNLISLPFWDCAGNHLGARATNRFSNSHLRESAEPYADGLQSFADSSKHTPLEAVISNGDASHMMNLTGRLSLFLFPLTLRRKHGGVLHHISTKPNQLQKMEPSSNPGRNSFG